MAQIHVNTIADICAKQGVERAIISPGSRNAPLTIAFNRHPEIKCYSISDERSAAFIALGMAQSSGKTIALICTSGSAALNYAPAIAEAYFQQVPLLVLTADRPPEWIDQWDGQTIRQQNIYGRHVKASFHLPLIGEHPNEAWQAYRIVNEACLQSQFDEKGPVHVNIPFREPFYPTKDHNWEVDKSARVISKVGGRKELQTEQIKELKATFDGKDKVAFLLGQDNYTQEFLTSLDQFSASLQIPIFADVISNGHQLKNAIKHTDSAGMYLAKQAHHEFIPDLVISFGKSVISKNLKLLLRNNSIEQWHVNEFKSDISDPFQSLTKSITANPFNFLSVLNDSLKKDKGFLTKWKQLNEQLDKKKNEFLIDQSSFNEFSSLRTVIDALPQNADIHLANSLSVRYVNFIGLESANRVWCNRGTSGIDGSNSTAMGHAIVASDRQHVLITGDVAFFYDRNAFWHKYPYHNLKIVLLNNNGGSIFRMINGPRDQPELEEFFETEQKLDAASLSQEFDIDYYPTNDSDSLALNLSKWLESKNCSLLEIKSDSKNNQQIFELFKKHIQN